MMLSDVCLLRTSGLSRKQRPRKTYSGTEVAHVTHDSIGPGHHFQGQKVKVTRPLYSPRPTCESGVAVTVGTYWAWEIIYCCIASAWRRVRRWGARVEEIEAGISFRHAHNLLLLLLLTSKLCSPALTVKTVTSVLLWIIWSNMVQSSAGDGIMATSLVSSHCRHLRNPRTPTSLML